MTPLVADTLTTARLVLRRPLAEDLPAYAAYCTSARSQFSGGPFSEAQAFDKLSSMAGHWLMRGFGRYVMQFKGRGIGHAGPFLLDEGGTPEMTWTLWDGTLEGQGLASEAVQAICADLLAREGWPEFIIRVLPDNGASIRMAERIGARLTDEPAPEWYPAAYTYRLAAADLRGALT